METMEMVLEIIPAMVPEEVLVMAPAAVLAVAPAAVPAVAPAVVPAVAPAVVPAVALAAVPAEALVAGAAVLAVHKEVLEYMEILIRTSEKERADAGKSFQMDGFSTIRMEKMQKMSGAIYIMELQAERTGIVLDRMNT